MKKLIPLYKRILSVAMAIVVCAGLVLCTNTAEAAGKKSKSKNDYAAGDNISFGRLDGQNLNWTVLAFNEETREAFVISRNTISTDSYLNYRGQIANFNKGRKVGYVTWGQNLWRAWLNGAFYNNCFNDAERKMIQPTVISKASEQNSVMNFYHDTNLDKYYKDNDNVKNSLNMAIYNNQYSTTDYVYFLSFDEYNAYKDTIVADGGFWALRTNAYDDPIKTLYVNDKTQMIERKYHYDAQGSGIRPAMVINVGAATESTDVTGATKKTSSTSTTGTANQTATATAANASSTSANANSSSTSANSTASTNTVKRKSYANNATDISAVSSGSINLPTDSQYSMKKNGTAKVAIDLSYLNSTNKDYTVSYKSSDASVFTVDSNGNVSAVGAVGSATLSVRMTKSNGKIYSMTCRIDVT